MDEEFILFGIRNLFALGNYQTVINELLVSLIHCSRQIQLVINDIGSSEEASLKAIRLLALYLSDKEKDGHVQNAIALLEEGSNRINSVVQVSVATILVHAGRLDDALKTLHSRQRKFKCSALVVQIYLQLDRLDLARNEVASVKKWAEDALQLQLLEAWLDLRIGGDKYQEAYYIYEEFAQSNTAQTAKVLNGQAVANIALGRYPEAESLLLEAQNKDNDNPDTLINLITCSTLTGKSQEVVNRYTSQLREVDPKHPYLQELDLKSSLFDRCASRYSA
ncbi:unnamed protein product [Rhizopus stolonifer]